MKRTHVLGAVALALAVAWTPALALEGKLVIVTSYPPDTTVTVKKAFEKRHPGVTVEKKEGQILFDDGVTGLLIDLPGAYSLSPQSLDEEVVHNVLLGRQRGTPLPDLCVIVVDAANLERNLFFATQIIETGIPSILVLN